MKSISITVFFLLFIIFNPLIANDEKKDSLYWPQPPDRARIQHLRTIGSLADLEIKSGFFSKVFSFLFGSPKSQTWLEQPVGIAVSPNKTIAIADPGAHGIHLINQVEREYILIRETKFGTISSPVGVAFSEEGLLYVSDSENGKIIVFNDNLNAKFYFDSHLKHPTGITVTKDTIYVVDTREHKIVFFNLEGEYLGEFGKRGAGEGEFNFPVNLISVCENLYIVDALNYRIVQTDKHGKYQASFGEHGNVAGRFAAPKGIACDSDSNLYITDALMDNFQIFNQRGKLLLVVGRNGLSNGEFMSPSGIAIDNNNIIYIVDSLNKRIQLFRYLP